MNNYKIIFCSLLLAFLSCTQKENKKFEVEGTIKNAPSKIVYLEEVSLETMRPVIVDSSSIDNSGAYKLETLAKEEGLYNIRLGQNTYPLLTLVNDADEVTVNADLKNIEAPYTIKGSMASQQIKEYLEYSGNQIKKLFEKGKIIDSLQKAKTADSLMTGIVAEQQKGINSFKSYTTELINKSKSPALSLFILGTYQSFSFNPLFKTEAFTDQQVSNLIVKTATKFPKHTTLAKFKTNIANAAIAKQKASLIGKQAPNFTLNDTNGNPVSLSSFKGKYILIDFWASWCPPCRAENPNIVNAFKMYKDKNFTILGVSLDKEKAPWLEAIKKDSLTWTHVSDLKFWESQVVPLYNFNEIPYNVLLDTNGKVIAEHLRGNELSSKLSEVLR